MIREPRPRGYRSLLYAETPVQTAVVKTRTRRRRRKQSQAVIDEQLQAFEEARAAGESQPCRLDEPRCVPPRLHHGLRAFIAAHLASLQTAA